MGVRWKIEDVTKMALKKASVQTMNNFMNDEIENPVFEAKHRRKKPEEALQIKVAEYLRMKYPNVIFRSDFAAGIKMTKGQAVKHKRMQSGRAYPDVFIAEMRNGAGGLYLELKKDVSEILKTNGELRNDAHVIEQQTMLERLRERGYAAFFACGFDEAITIIEQYLNG